MKRRLFLSTILFAATALTFAVSSSSAGGLNLSWNDCGSFGVLTRTSACTNNASAGTLYASCVAPVPMPQLNGQTGIVDIQINAVSLSPWWQIGSAGCVGRTSAVSSSMDFTTDLGNCLDIWNGQGSPGTIVLQGFGGSNRDRIKATGATAAANNADDVTEMYIFKLTISGARTTGTGACTGCLDAACIVYNDQLLTQPLGVGDFHVTNELTRRYVIWQSTFNAGAGGTDPCPVFVPTRRATWGSVKSLYR